MWLDLWISWSASGFVGSYINNEQTLGLVSHKVWDDGLYNKSDFNYWRIPRISNYKYSISWKQQVLRYKPLMTNIQGTIDKNCMVPFGSCCDGDKDKWNYWMDKIDSSGK